MCFGLCCCCDILFLRPCHTILASRPVLLYESRLSLYLYPIGSSSSSASPSSSAAATLSFPASHDQYSTSFRSVDNNNGNNATADAEPNGHDSAAESHLSSASPKEYKTSRDASVTAFTSADVRSAGRSLALTVHCLRLTPKTK